MCTLAHVETISEEHHWDKHFCMYNSYPYLVNIALQLVHDCCVSVVLDALL